jgi:PAS domain S-box-containing protein
MRAPRPAQPGLPRIALRSQRSAPRPTHLVQFYESDSFLADSVGRFIGGALEAGHNGLVIATGSHLAHIEERFRERGIDLTAARAAGRYVGLDAEETLARLLTQGEPGDARFAEALSAVVNSVAGHGGLPMRAFGELVAILWARGEDRRAVRLEAAWNDLMVAHPISLLCAYPMPGFGRAADEEPFLEICGEHGAVLPAESYVDGAAPDERLRSIARLQQKATALEAEIVERKELERLLKRREEELSDFLENAVEGLHRVGPDGTILWANAAEMTMLGYAHDEYIGHPAREFHVEPGAFDDMWERLLRGEPLRDWPARLRCKDGSIKDVLIHANALHEDGRLVHTRGFTRDVTERVLAEARLAALLERERAARADAERLVRSKDEFVATLSHELRTPLTAMLGWLRLVRRGELEPRKLGQAFEVLERNARAQARLIEDLVDASRILTGHLRLESRPLDLAALIEDAVDGIRPAAEARGVRLEAVLDATVGPVPGDRDRLSQVVANLLTNAIKYTPEGGRVEIALRRAGAGVEITVTDSGIGIPPGFMSQLFERFSQAGAARVRGRAGLGLGLAIVRDLVELHGGSVRAESAGEGLGATFTVSLPAPVGFPPG